MRPFDYYKVTSVAQAVSLLSKHQQKAAILAGGTDLLARMKDHLEGPKMKMPDFLIDQVRGGDLAERSPSPNL